MKTGEACEGIALKYAEECAMFDAVADVRTVAVVIDGRGQRRVLLRQGRMSAVTGQGGSPFS